MTFTNPLITDISNKVPITKYSVLLFLFCTLLMISPASAFSGDGSGTDTDPYVIMNLSQLNETRNDLDAYYILGADIDASDTVTWDGGAGFEPIGTFDGNFDGQGYTITGLYIDRSSTDYIGLFGSTSGSSITNVNLEDVNITGQYSVGGLVGHNVDSSINQSYSTGNVTGYSDVGGLVGYHSNGFINMSYSTANVNGNNNNIGGLVGYHPNGFINMSYSTGDIIGHSYVGGLVGSNYGSVNQSYSVGSVSGNTLNNIGGLVGGGGSGSMNQCYWNNVTSGQTESAGGTPLTTSEMKGSAAFNNMNGFDTEMWDVVESGVISYPYLINNKQEPEPGLESLYAGGDGSELDPYQIENWYHLDNMRINLDSNFTLVNDINETTEGYNEITGESANDGAGFEPIGDSSTKFTGTFDGNGSIISNLVINRSSTDYVGLFGYTYDASISNVSLEDVNVTGNSDVGGLVGWNHDSSVVNQSYSRGNVNGSGENVGGLVGYNSASSINQSYSTGTVTSPSNNIGGLVGSSDSSSLVIQSYSTSNVTGNGNVGGLVGQNLNSIVNQSYSTGSVIGDSDFIGGLVGENAGSVTQCYSTGSVNAGNGNVGGLVGDNSAGSVTQSYSTGTVTGSYNDGGLVGWNDGGSVSASYWDNETSSQPTGNIGEGKTTEEMTNPYTYTTVYNKWDFENVWDMSIDTNDGYPHLLALNYETTSPYEGSGTSGDPYQISDVYELQYAINDLNANYILINDIDASGTSDWNNGDGFEPIGDFSTKFTGTFDGNGFVISDLTINRSNKDNIGMFGCAASVKVENLELSNVEINGSKNTAALIGYLSGNSALITNSSSSGIINGKTGCGGIIGRADTTSSTIINSSSSATIVADVFEGWSDTGGLVGWSSDGEFTIDRSYATGDITAQGRNVGGLIGGSSGDINRSYATGDVSIINTNQGQVGGLVGALTGSSSISNSYASGNVTAEGNNGTDETYWQGSGVGGLVGYIRDDGASIAYCYASGRVYADDGKIGGLIGNNSNGTASNVAFSYWDNETSGQTSSDGGDGGTTENMTYPYNSNTYIDWDFSNIWGIHGGINDGYPALLNLTNFPPNVSITDPDSNSNISGTFFVNASVTDPNGDLYRSSVYLNNTTGNIDNHTNIPQDDDSVTFDSTSLTDGIYNITWKAYENETEDALFEFQTINITIDNTNPELFVNGDTTNEGNFSQDNITCNISFSDANLNSSTIAIYNISGLVDSNTSSISPHSVTFENLEEGTYQINSTVSDTAGNIAEMTTRDIVLDITSPYINQIVAPSDVNTSDTVEIGFNVTDNIGINHSLTDFNIIGNTSAELTEDGTWYNYTLNVPSDSIDDIVFNATFYDDAGNLNASDAFTINVSDNIAPVIQNIVYEEDVNTSDSLIIGFNVTDNIGVNHSLTEFNITGNNSAELTWDGNWYNYTLNVPRDSLNGFDFNATFYDDAGNFNASDDMTINVSDNIKPAYDWSDKVISANTSENITIKLNATDNIGVELYNITVDGEEYQMKENSGNYTHNISIPASDSGTLVSSITYNCTFGDAAGNMNSTGDVVIDVSILPIANFSANVTKGTTPLSVEFTDNSSGLVEEWNWDFGDSNISTDQNPSHVFDTGNYTVNLTVENINGTSSKELNIRAAEEPVYEISPNETELLSTYGNEKNFSINSTLYSSYEWFIDGTPLNGTGVTLYNNNTDDSAHLSYCNVNTSQYIDQDDFLMDMYNISAHVSNESIGRTDVFSWEWTVTKTSAEDADDIDQIIITTPEVNESGGESYVRFNTSNQTSEKTGIECSINTVSFNTSNETDGIQIKIEVLNASSLNESEINFAKDSVYQYMDISFDNKTLVNNGSENRSIEFKVLNNVGGGSLLIDTVYLKHKNTTGWQSYESELLRNDGTYSYFVVRDIPGFSPFAVTADYKYDSGSESDDGLPAYLKLQMLQNRSQSTEEDLDGEEVVTPESESDDDTVQEDTKSDSAEQTTADVPKSNEGDSSQNLFIGIGVLGLIAILVLVFRQRGN